MIVQVVSVMVSFGFASCEARIVPYGNGGVTNAMNTMLPTRRQHGKPTNRNASDKSKSTNVAGPNDDKETTKKGKNIVICCDGTGKDLGDSLKYSNVAQLYGMLMQSVDSENRRSCSYYYSAGVGTVTPINAWNWLRLLWKSSILGGATGAGMENDVVKAYTFLMQEYEPGDQIFLFGFSRGAYTVRVLAGLIQAVGLLRYHPSQQGLAVRAMAVYNRAAFFPEKFDWSFWDLTQKDWWPLKQKDGSLQESQQDKIDEALGNATTWGCLTQARQDVPIHFMGCWDTVSSIIVPRTKLWPLSTMKLPLTEENGQVRHFRQACAIDERRRMFRLLPWNHKSAKDDNDEGLEDGESITDKNQDSKQVWFVGCHGDVGGGWKMKQSELAKISLQWMIHEANECGLDLDLNSTLQSSDLIARNYSSDEYRIHNSMFSLWPLLEIPPKARMNNREWEPSSVSLQSKCYGIGTKSLIWSGFCVATRWLLQHTLQLVFGRLLPTVLHLKTAWNVVLRVGLVGVLVKYYKPEPMPSDEMQVDARPSSETREPENVFQKLSRQCPTAVQIVVLGVVMVKAVPYCLGECAEFLKPVWDDVTHGWMQWLANHALLVDIVSTKTTWVGCVALSAWLWWNTYTPLGEPRCIPPNDGTHSLHPSVLECLEQRQHDYRPTNLKRFLTGDDNPSDDEFQAALNAYHAAQEAPTDLAPQE